MFKNETFYSWPKGIDFEVSLKKIDERIKSEFNLEQAQSGYREWDMRFSILKSDNEHYVCDKMSEFYEVLSSLPFYDSFTWHNTYRGKPIRRLFRGIVRSSDRFGAGIDYAKSRIVIGVHANGNLAFIERVHELFRNEISLSRPERIESDGYRRKMLEPNVFIGRHFDSTGNEYYARLSDFLRLLGFQPVQGEEYTSDAIPEKVKHRIDQQDIVVIMFSGDRDHSWLISEAAYAEGKGKHVVLLMESSIKVDTGILGRDLEYISFPDACIEKSYVSLLREFRSVGVKGIFY